MSASRRAAEGAARCATRWPKSVRKRRRCAKGGSRPTSPRTWSRARGDPTRRPGIILAGPFARHTQQVMDGYKAKGYERMLATLRNGPPGGSAPGRWRRRTSSRTGSTTKTCGGRTVRPAPARSRDGRHPVGLAADERLIARRRVNGAGLVLKTPDGRRRVVKEAEPRVTITGAPGELVLFMTGRQEAADVTYDGEPDAVATSERPSSGSEPPPRSSPLGSEARLEVGAQIPFGDLGARGERHLVDDDHPLGEQFLADIAVVSRCSTNASRSSACPGRSCT